MFCFFTLALAAFNLAAASEAILNPFAAGSVIGTRNGNVKRFTLPYAEPPVGDLRLADPVIKKSLGSRYDARKPPPVCPQLTDSGPVGSEDCLYMNVFAPLDALNDSHLPVFVWVHGGSYFAGSITSKGLSDPWSLAAEQNIIIVTIQYRLGALGWLAYDKFNLDGNYGLKDIIVALQYLKINVKYFGGNPQKITLAGHSTGASMVASLLNIKSVSHLFDNAILHSAPLGIPELPKSVANQHGAIAATFMNATSLAALRNLSILAFTHDPSNYYTAPTDIWSNKPSPLPVNGMLSVQQTNPMGLVIDGKLITKQFLSVATTGKLANNKKVILTTVKDEACVTTAVASPVWITLPSFDAIISVAVGAKRAATLIASKLYISKSTNKDDLASSLTQLDTDALWTCPNQQTAVRQAAQGELVWLAEFDVGVSYYNDSIPTCKGKVGHEDDILLFFETGLSGEQKKASSELRARWGAFTRTGNPNTRHYTNWAASKNSSNLNLLVFGKTENQKTTIAKTQRSTACSSGLWGNKLPYT